MQAQGAAGAAAGGASAGAAGASAGQGSSKPEDDVVDAEFKEVKKD